MAKVAPSLLSADFSRLGEEVRRMEEAGADMVHLDIMDGNFVPNLTFGPPVVRALRDRTALPFDAHLMVGEPDRIIEDVVAAGADIVTIHGEACAHLHRGIAKILTHGARAGVALNPATPVDSLYWVGQHLELVLIMAVDPGFGGQAFIPATLDKIKALRELREEQGWRLEIAVDGGLNQNNVDAVVQAGADIIVAGSAVFSAEDAAAAIAALRGSEGMIAGNNS